MRKLTWAVVTAFCLCVLSPARAQTAPKLKVLLVDGQNNHDWRSCQPVIKWILEESGRFVVDLATSPPPAPRAPAPPKADATPEQKDAHQKALAKVAEQQAEIARQWAAWRPKFADYSAVVCNYNGDSWPAEVKTDFTRYVAGGGGLVIIHAANNAFPDWPEFNEMIAVGGWGGRNEKSGPMVRWREGKIVFDTKPGPGGGHGAQHEFLVEAREPEHPILKGLPLKWRHATDELYSNLRGPAKNLTVLATAYADPRTRGTGEHEPILMAIAYEKGRVFHTVLGHGPFAMSGIGFQATLQRGTEWVATGQVTLPAPKPADLPEDKAVLRKPPGVK